jgi:hypothetical protein
MTTLVATLRVPLKGFNAPDTASPFEGRVEIGTWRVLETRTAGGDDFARLALTHFGGEDTWICTKSKGVIYADVRPAPEPAARLDFSADPRAIDETRLTALFSSFDGFVYDRDDGQYPWPLPGVALRTQKKQNNCCTFVEALIVKAFEGTSGFSWSLERHNQMMINGADRFGPVTAAVESGMAVPAPGSESPPQPWSIVQGWRTEHGGHTFLVVDHDPDTDRLLMLESNSSAELKLNGPGYRAFGALQTFAGKAPPLWQQSAEAWTWHRVCSTYPERLHASLKVKNRSLSALPAG